MQDVRYYSAHNFVGRVIKGYYANRCILTRVAAEALAKVQQDLQEKNQRLVVYDCYRPQQAVVDFMQWSKTSDQRMKMHFYPRENKQDLFDNGYIARYSAHSRGSTVDLSIYQVRENPQGVTACYADNRKKEQSVDMGTNYDCLDPSASIKSKKISKKAVKNRRRLAKLMKKYGFKPYSKEWWHFSFRQAPFKKTYFNFPVQ